MNNIKVDLREIGCDDGKWMELAQDSVEWWTFLLMMMNCVMLSES
jgi:hypothetical protein